MFERFRNKMGAVLGAAAGGLGCCSFASCAAPVSFRKFHFIFLCYCQNCHTSIYILQSWSYDLRTS